MADVGETNLDVLDKLITNAKIHIVGNTSTERIMQTHPERG